MKGLWPLFVLCVSTFAFALAPDAQRIDLTSVGKNLSSVPLEEAAGIRTHTFVTEGWYTAPGSERCSPGFLNQLMTPLLEKIDTKKIYLGFIASCFIEPKNEPIPFLLNFEVKAIKREDAFAVREFIRFAESQPAFGNSINPFLEVRRVLTDVHVGAGIAKGSNFTENREDLAVLTFSSLIEFDTFMNQAQKAAFSASDPAVLASFLAKNFSPAALAESFQTTYLQKVMPKVNYIRAYNTPANSLIPFPMGTYLLRDGGTAMAVGQQPFLLVRDCRKSTTGYCN